MSQPTAKLRKSNHRRNLLHGAGQVLILMPRREYQIPKRGGFVCDALAIRQDFDRVGRDMNYALKEHGEG